MRRTSAPSSAGRPSWTARGLVIPTVGDLARIDPRSGRVQKLFGALIDASIGMDTTAVSPDLSTLTFVGARAPNPGDNDCGAFGLCRNVCYPRCGGDRPACPSGFTCTDGACQPGG